MAQVEPHQAEIGSLGSLVYIAAQKRGGMFKPEEYLRKHPIGFPFLLDEDRAVTKAYGVHHRLGLDAVNIARPATFVINPFGTIRYVYVGSSQTDRAPVAEVIQALKLARTK